MTKKAKSVAIPVADTLLKAKVAKKPGCVRRLLNYIIAIFFFFVCVAALIPGKPKITPLPTSAVLPSPTFALSVTEVIPTASLLVPPSATIADKLPSIAPTSTITDTPQPPTIAPARPTQSSADMAMSALTTQYNLIVGVFQVDSVIVLPMDAGKYVVYTEVQALPGANFQALAEQMQHLTFTELVTASLDFTVMFNDGTHCADYTFDNPSNAWRYTSIRCPGADAPIPLPAPTVQQPAVQQPTAVPQPVVQTDVISLNPVTYYADNGGANLRGCPKTNCTRIDAVQTGAALTVNGMVDGDEVDSGNKLWYRITYGGQEAYVYSGLVDLFPPTTVQVAPVVSDTQSQSSIPAASSNNSVCPSNCTEARAMGVSASRAADCGLDRDHDGVACYGD